MENMVLIQKSIVFEVINGDMIDVIHAMINEAEDHGWHYDIIVESNNHKYIVNKELMEKYNWSYSKVVDSFCSKRNINMVSGCDYKNCSLDFKTDCYETKWYCETCNKYLSPCRVTHDEKCDICGENVC